MAWRAFEHRLAAELVELPLGCTIELRLPIGRSGTSSLVLRFKSRPVTFVMTASYGLPATAGGRPRRTPPAGVPPVKVFRRDADVEVGRWATCLMREAYGAIHPAFVIPVRTDADGVELPRPVLTPTVANTGKHSADDVSDDERLTESADELDALVLQTLESLTGESIERDSDGDIPIVGEHGVVYVRVLRDRPVIEAFAILQNIDADALSAYHDAVNQWNSLSSVETFVIDEGQLRVRVAVLGRRFRPSSVTTAVTEVVRAIAEYVAFVADQEPLTDDEEPEDEAGADHATGATAGATEEAQTIMQLEAAEVGDR